MAKILVSLPDPLLKQTDRLARAQHRSRSEVVREALRLLLERETGPAVSWADTMGVIRERVSGHWKGHWDSTTVIRGDRDTGYGPRTRR